MANALYNSAKSQFLQGGMNLALDTIKVALIDTGTYTFSQSHSTIADIPGGSVIGTAQPLANKTVATGGVFDADDVTFTGVSGNSIEAYIIYRDTGTPSTSYLIAFFDSVTSGLPITPNGGDILLQFSNGASKIFSL